MDRADARVAKLSMQRAMQLGARAKRYLAAAHDARMAQLALRESIQAGINIGINTEAIAALTDLSEPDIEQLLSEE